jgi:hypothetical protein
MCGTILYGVSQSLALSKSYQDEVAGATKETVPGIVDGYTLRYTQASMLCGHST